MHIDSLDAANLFSLKGKNAIVTGGSRGMGREICRAFARAGCNVIIASRKLDNCAELAKLIEEECPSVRAVPFACHIGKWDECQLLYDFAYKMFGSIDILVNNAGGSPLYESLKEVSEKYFDSIIGLNLKGPFRLSALIGSKMCEQNGGSIIMVSSESTVGVTPRETVYAAAKSGVNYLTQSFAHAYGPKVRCNCIQPGPFLTDISKAWDLDAVAAGLQQRSALMRAGRPDEIVGAALYLASDASSFTTGSILRVDGLPGGSGARDPDHSRNLDYERDVRPLMGKGGGRSRL
jgi:NAD(P)-dependent dehydrogenase (short-subunit alcohol dehydrogenase family)